MMTEEGLIDAIAVRIYEHEMCRCQIDDDQMTYTCGIVVKAKLSERSGSSPWSEHLARVMLNVLREVEAEVKAAKKNEIKIELTGTQLEAMKRLMSGELT